MRWSHVKTNWEAFSTPIIERWPDVDENELIRIDGDRALFVEYLSSIDEMTPDEADEEIDIWLVGAVPSDVVMDEEHDDASMRDSASYVPAGEDPSDDDRRFGDDGQPDNPIGRD